MKGKNSAQKPIRNLLIIVVTTSPNMPTVRRLVYGNAAGTPRTAHRSPSDLRIQRQRSDRIGCALAALNAMASVGRRWIARAQAPRSPWASVQQSGGSERTATEAHGELLKPVGPVLRLSKKCPAFE
jgi:hypothetical protein